MHTLQAGWLRWTWVIVAACGTSESGSDAGARRDGAMVDGGAVADGGSTCPGDVASMEGMACAVDGLDCGPPCTDACRFCVLFRCMGGVWARLEAHPAPCFDCGAELRCMSYAQYCHVITSDVAGVPGTYECVELPDGCMSTPTCECVSATVGFDECTEGSGGALTLTRFGG